MRCQNDYLTTSLNDHYNGCRVIKIPLRIQQRCHFTGKSRQV
jgi:hypothetical protein